MRRNVISVTLSLFFVSLLACSTEERNDHNKNFKKNDTALTQKVEIYSDKLEDNYNKIIKPDTNGCESFRRGRGLVVILENKKSSIETNGVELYLKTGKIRMWVCNLPKSLKSIGDTIMVSGYVYNIFGDERTLGMPTILHTIRLKDH